MREIASGDVPRVKVGIDGRGRCGRWLEGLVGGHELGDGVADGLAGVVGGRDAAGVREDAVDREAGADAAEGAGVAAVVREGDRPDAHPLAEVGDQLDRVAVGEFDGADDGVVDAVAGVDGPHRVEDALDRLDAVAAFREAVAQRGEGGRVIVDQEDADRR